MDTSNRISMRLMILVFVRASELTETLWAEIDLENEQQVIPWAAHEDGKKKVNPCKTYNHVNIPGRVRIRRQE